MDFLILPQWCQASNNPKEKLLHKGYGELTSRPAFSPLHSVAAISMKQSNINATHKEGASALKPARIKWRSHDLSEALVERKGASHAVVEHKETIYLGEGSADNEKEEEEEEEEEDLDSVERESLKLLEWSSVCEQVSRFASTPIGREVCRGGSIPFGKNQEESEELLEQTASACLIPSPLDFSGIVDVSEILRSASAGIVCNVNDLCVIEKMMSSTRRVYEQLQCAVPVKSATVTAAASTYRDDGSHSPPPIMTTTIAGEESFHKGHHAFSPLMSIMEGANFCTSLVQELKKSVDSASLSILNTASVALAATRASRRENLESLEALLLDIGEKVVAAGGMDSIIVTTRRARQCVAVRASHRHLLPGGVVLDLSNSGATVFMEPKTALELNNKEVWLASKEKEEEFSILESLTQKLADVAEDIWILLQKVTFLDLACAKADHAKWLHSVKPAFDSERFLPKNRKNHATGSSEAIGAFSVFLEGLSHPLLLGPALVDSQKQAERSVPVPVDFKVKSGVSVIVISGPNTGGKTASMKTLGVATLMAKAGLFLPAKGKALLPWFDKVLADIGDSQSLEQSLSTFSGHIQRVCRIMEAGGDRSLVLFDEIGSGTDPSEGAALATAILQHMAENVCLTVVTTHFSKLSSIRDRRFEVASVEFDIETLRPKYRVLWGVAGQSNALDIASSLGVDGSILARARHWMRKLAPENREQRVTQLMDPLLEQRKILQSQAEVAAAALSDAKKLHDELAAEADGLEMRIAALRLQQEERVKRDIDVVKSCMDGIVSNFERSSRNSDESGKSMSMGEALSAIASEVETYMRKFGETEKTRVKFEAADRPSVGDCVLIKRLGRNLATVIEAPTENDESFLVQLGSLKLRAKLSEVAKIVKEEKSPAGQQRSKGMIPRTPVESTEVRLGAAIQTSRNTVDLRGMRVEDALMHLDFALLRQSRRGSVLFVVHGEGTGALRAAVLQKLKGHSLVSKFEQESPMNYGCTVVYIK